MTILSKPAITRGTPAVFTLNKADLAALPGVVADAYYSDMSNWCKVIMFFKSATGRQIKPVEFDATQTTPTGKFVTTLKSRDDFQIQRIMIIDFDGDTFIVPRSDLIISDFDIALPPVTIWDAGVSGYSLLSNNGLQRNIDHNNGSWNWGAFATASSKTFTGDFMLVYEASSPGDLLTGWFAGVIAGGVSHGLTVDTDGAMKVHQQGSFRTASLQSNIVNGNNTFGIARVGSILRYYINGTKVYELDYGSTPSMTAAVRLGGKIATVYEDDIPAEGTPIVYNLSNNPGSGFNLEADGGVSGGTNTNSESFVKSTTSGDTDDCEYEWDFDWTGLSNVNTFIGVTSDNTTGGGWYANLTCIETAGSANQARYWFHGVTQGSFALATGPHTLKLSRVGTVVTMYLDGVQVYQNSNWPGSAVYPTVRPYMQQACTASRKMA